MRAEKLKMGKVEESGMGDCASHVLYYLPLKLLPLFYFQNTKQYICTNSLDKLCFVFRHSWRIDICSHILFHWLLF